MDIGQRLQRSRSDEQIDFSKIECKDLAEDLVKLESRARVAVEPIWTVPGDFEGRLYADYIDEHPGYDGIYVRQQVQHHLQRAAAALDTGLQLVVRAGHRPIAVQQRLLNDVRHEYMRTNPEATASDALAHARVYVSDPAIKLPPHCCGAAVDVELFDTRTGEFVDFGSPINFDADISHLHSDKITESQHENRMQLLTAMLTAGFASYYGEWWHYSYGDEIWAWFYDKPACLYSVVDVEVDHRKLSEPARGA